MFHQTKSGTKSDDWGEPEWALQYMFHQTKSGTNSDNLRSASKAHNSYCIDHAICEMVSWANLSD